MDDIRDTRPWFWILFLIVFAVAVAGVLLAISAKDDSVNESQIAKEATAEVREELSGLDGAIKAADEFQEESKAQAAQDRRQLKRAVNEAVAQENRRVRGLQGRVADLEAETSELEGENSDLSKQVNNLVSSQERLEAELERIDTRLRNLNNGS